MSLRKETSLSVDVTDDKVRELFRRTGANDFFYFGKGNLYFLKYNGRTVGRIHAPKIFDGVLESETRKINENSN